MYSLKINDTYVYEIFNFTENYLVEENSTVLTVASRCNSEEIKTLMSLSEMVKDVSNNQTLNLKIFFNENLILETNNYILKIATITSQLYYIFDKGGEEPSNCEDIVTVDMEFRINSPDNNEEKDTPNEE